MARIALGGIPLPVIALVVLLILPLSACSRDHVVVGRSHVPDDATRFVVFYPHGEGRWDWIYFQWEPTDERRVMVFIRRPGEGAEQSFEFEVFTNTEEDSGRFLSQPDIVYVRDTPPPRGDWVN